jgi:hypothetical protein
VWRRRAMPTTTTTSCDVAGRVVVVIRLSMLYDTSRLVLVWERAGEGMLLGL